jgi:hypothetical protein
VVSGSVSRFHGHGGIGFTRIVRAWRAQANGEQDRGCGLARMAGRGGRGNLPLHVACPCSPSDFHLGEEEESTSGRKGMSHGARRSAMQGRARWVALRRLDGPGRLRLFGRWRLSGAATQGWAGLGWVGRLAMRLVGTAAGGDRTTRVRRPTQAMGQKQLSFVV